VTKRAVLLRRLRAATPLSLSDRPPLFALARHLGVKPDQRSLFGWCAKNGVGIDAFMLQTLPVTGPTRIHAWLEARHQEGIFWDTRSSEVVATLSEGKVKGDAGLAGWLEVLTPTADPGWEGPARAKAKPAPGGPALTARVDMELTSRAQLKKLPAVPKRQLEAASQGLCGKMGLDQLMAWCDAEGQGLARVEVLAGETVRFEAWLTAALEDGAFFEAGGSVPCGLLISQGDVEASQSARERDVAALQRAMSKLKAPRAPKWKG